jgi:hypothetical protein
VGGVLLLIGYLLLIATQVAWALLWLKPPHTIEKAPTRLARAALAVLSSLPFALWLTVVAAATAQPRILGDWGDVFVSAVWGRPSIPMVAAAYAVWSYQWVAVERMSRSGTSLRELGLIVCGWAPMILFAAGMMVR